MIPVEKITEQEIERRFNSLPKALQETLDSAQNLQVVNRICEGNLLLDEERKFIVQQIATLVLLGYIHPERVGLELEQELGVNHKVAALIAEALNSRIFSSFKNDLDKVYAPFTPEEKKTEEVKKPAPAMAEAPKPPPKPFMDLSSLSSGFKAASAPPTKPIASPPPPAGGPTSIPIQVKWKTYGEVPKPVTTPPQTPPPAPLPTTPAAPAPVFLKRKLELEPLKPETSIRLEPVSPSQFGTGKSQITQPPQPPRPARLEIGQAPLQSPGAARPGKPVITEMTPPRVVHYGQWKTPVAKAETPKPPFPPTPPPPVKPSVTPPPTTPPPPAKQMLK